MGSEWTRRSILASAPLLAVSPLAAAGIQDVEQKPAVIFLIRHAEDEDGENDPNLTDAGRARVERLVHMLGDSGITGVHSTDYIRTRDTANPIAKSLGVETQIYDPRDMRGVAERLTKAGGRHLVVGHSNTTPGMVRLLGGEPGDPIREPSEFDRLYVVTISTDGEVSTVFLRS